MNRRTAPLALAMAMLGPSSWSAAQAPPASPPILSTQATPPSGSITEPSQMSGYPLQVGDLPPGNLAIRVIRQSFVTNVPNQIVTLRVGSSDRVLSANTNAEGRVQFDGLAVGDVIRVRAKVGAEFLESQAFTMPAQGGVRMLLVAGVGAGVASFADAWPAPTEVASAPLPVVQPVQAATLAAATSAAPAGAGAGASDAGIAITIVLGALFVVSAVVFSRRGRTPVARDASADETVVHRAPAPPAMPVARPPVVTPSRREMLLDELVSVEKAHRAGLSDEAVYSARKEELMEQLLALDAPDVL